MGIPRYGHRNGLIELYRKILPPGSECTAFVGTSSGHAGLILQRCEDVQRMPFCLEGT